MKKYVLVLLLTLPFTIGYAQVGINTENPLGIFHVDPKGNTTLSKDNDADDVIILNNGNVGIGTATPTTKLDVAGLVRVRTLLPLNTTGRPVAVYADPNYGLLGLKPSDPDEVIESIFVGETRNTNKYLEAIFNNGNPIVVPFTKNDFKINNLDISMYNNYFKIHDSGTYMLSVSVNFVIGVSSPDNLPGKIFINVSVERSSNGGASWSSIAGTRPVLLVYWNVGQALPIILPTVVSKLESDDLLRVTFYRTKSGSSFQGDPVSSISTSYVYNTPSYTFILTKL